MFTDGIAYPFSIMYIYMAEVVLYSDHCSRLKYTYDNSICDKNS